MKLGSLLLILGLHLTNDQALPTTTTQRMGRNSHESGTLTLNQLCACVLMLVLKSHRHLFDSVLLHFEHELIVHLHDHARRLRIQRLRLASMQQQQHAMHRSLHDVGRTALTQSVRNFATSSGTSLLVAGRHVQSSQRTQTQTQTREVSDPQLLISVESGVFLLASALADLRLLNSVHT